ncbi:putative cation-transporting p-type ATPase C [Desulfosarcina variabilis str. Montpellier]|uniref:HMA2 domain-containing protein n=1 Tax=Desulfosarcina variabilis TaxID=2300 RepID=UPI003AFA0C7D
MGKCYIHHIPGRLRIRIPTLKNNPQGIEQVRSLLSVEGTHSFTASSLTGSIIVTYDPQKLNKQYLLDILKEHGLYCEERSTTMESQLQQASENAARKVSRAMFGWAVGRVLEANGLSIIAAFI